MKTAAVMALLVGVIACSNASPGSGVDAAAPEGPSPGAGTGGVGGGHEPIYTPPDSGTGGAGSENCGGAGGGAAGQSGCGAGWGPAGQGGTGGGPPVLPVPDPLYRMVESRSIAAPVGDGVGLTFDGARFWVLGGGTVGPYQVVEYDPVTLASHRQFNLDLPRQGGVNINGLTWDGESLWVGISGNLNEMVQVDPATGAIRKVRSMPGELGPSDLDFDGHDFWLSNGIGEIFLLDRVTGGIKRSFFVMDPQSRRDHGIAFRPGELWIGALFGGMDVHDAETGAHLGGVIDAGGVRIRPDALGSSCFVKDQLVILSERGITYYDLKRLR
jgi:hypothetical protein